MGGTIVSPLDFVVGITEKRGARSCDLNVHLTEATKKAVTALKEEWQIKEYVMISCNFELVQEST